MHSSQLCIIVCLLQVFVAQQTALQHAMLETKRNQPFRPGLKPRKLINNGLVLQNPAATLQQPCLEKGQNMCSLTQPHKGSSVCKKCMVYSQLTDLGVVACENAVSCGHPAAGCNNAVVLACNCHDSAVRAKVEVVSSGAAGDESCLHQPTYHSN